MGSWNAMTYDGKETILRVVREEAEGFFDLVEQPTAWEAATACADWQTRDIVGHLVDVTETYFERFDAARSGAEVEPAYGADSAPRVHGPAARVLRPDTEPCDVGIRITSGPNAGDTLVRITPAGLSYEPGDVSGLGTVIEFDPGSFVLTTFGRCNAGTIRGDRSVADRYLNVFFRI